MKKLLQQSLLFLLLLPLLGRAQEVRISGRVVDAKTKEPIPFVTINLRKEKTDTFSNERGRFQFTGLKYKDYDSLVFNIYDYNSRVVLIKAGKTKGLVVELSKVVRLSEHIPTLSELRQKTEIYRESKKKIIVYPGNQYAFLIDNDSIRQTRRLRAVSFYIGENGIPVGDFRVRIYKNNGLDSPPGIDILTENVLFNGAGEKGWCNLDVSIYNILVSREGFFIALECVTMDYHPILGLNKYVHINKFIYPSLNTGGQRIWGYIAGKWEMIPINEAFSSYGDMIRVEVGPIKQ